LLWHRVVAAGARVGGFSARGGVSTKLRLLAIEGASFVYTLSLFDGESDLGAVATATQRSNERLVHGRRLHAQAQHRR
jgi:hypothetical protein